jgi:hypothetical protein
LPRGIRWPRKCPSIGDFAYLATNIAFFSPPQDIQAVSQATHALQTVEMLMAAALLASFAAQLGLLSGRQRAEVSADA